MDRKLIENEQNMDRKWIENEQNMDRKWIDIENRYRNQVENKNGQKINRKLIVTIQK